MVTTPTVFITLEQQVIHCQEEWILFHLPAIQQQYAALSLPKKSEININGAALKQLDTAGAWFLTEIKQRLETQGCSVHWKNFSKEHVHLLELVIKEQLSEKKLSPLPVTTFIERIGKSAVEGLNEFKGFLAFTGKVALETSRLLRKPSRIRWKALATVIDKTGVQALPIIALLSFMIGVVISYQMGNQLRNYGANVFIVDLLGLSILREFGPLLCAIMVAGRTGSAFTAQLGTMKLYQEIDALNTMGVTPEELLLIPRLMGLFFVLPLLTIWSDIFGVLGGMVMANNMLNISWYEFLQRFQNEIPLRALIIGIGKAPVFAMLIGGIGCFQGMLVRGSAESVGKLTTRSVVLSIFSIILADAIFSILFSKFKL